MLRANATVIHLGRIDTVKVGSNPTRRPTRAVEYNENNVEIMTDVKISVACLLTSCKNIENQFKFSQQKDPYLWHPIDSILYQIEII